MIEFKTIDDVLDFAITNEQRAYDFYSELAEKVSNPAMREAFRGFAEEETGHKEKLQHIKATKKFEISAAKIADLKIADYSVDVTASPDMTYQEALTLAMKREKAAFRLYTNLAHLADNEEVRSTFLALAQEEAKHKLRFEIEYDDNIYQEN
ncbi:MAG: ferritin family protein [Bacteroidetes bacterium]|nr:ferritin family protein [Bacteroidota bacterium]